MFFFCLQQSTATWFLHHSPYCFGLSHYNAAYPHPSPEPKLCQPISNTQCNHGFFYWIHTWLLNSIGKDKPTDSQHKLPPYRQECVRHFRYFCRWLAGRDPSTSLGILNPRHLCINVGTVTLSLTPRDSPMLSRNFPINQYTSEAFKTLCGWVQNGFQSLKQAASRAFNSSSMPTAHSLEEQAETVGADA